MKKDSKAVIDAYLKRVPKPVYVDDIPHEMDPFDLATFLEEIGYEDVVGMEECEVKELYLQVARNLNI